MERVRLVPTGIDPQARDRRSPTRRTSQAAASGAAVAAVVETVRDCWGRRRCRPDRSRSRSGRRSRRRICPEPDVLKSRAVLLPDVLAVPSPSVAWYPDRRLRGSAWCRRVRSRCRCSPGRRRPALSIGFDVVSPCVDVVSPPLPPGVLPPGRPRTGPTRFSQSAHAVSSASASSAVARRRRAMVNSFDTRVSRPDAGISPFDG